METAQELLIKGLAETGANVPGDAVDLFLHYLSELKRWNKAYNLTALKSDRDIIIKHFLDSLLFYRAFPEAIGDVCDVGSGAGFPGIPIAIVMRDIPVTLVEPSRKKCAFLRNISRALSLSNISVLESRIEDVEHTHFDIAVTRALFSIDEFIAKAKHIVRKGGCLIVNKGPKFQEELDKIPASTHFVHIPATLPLASLQRHLIRVTV
ncbi:MAG: 16S rRNA (guanine(527)-N(7))-methyltransferase RsmG [Nitrospirae bacterium]|nr:16S rRNA (guanine(527)-N(7))-methyltransferase RsmG [Nitrospirota bacterium]